MSAAVVERDVVEVDTETAAHAIGKTPIAFRRWAARREMTPHRKERRGRRTIALWDLELVIDAASRG